MIDMRPVVHEAGAVVAVGYDHERKRLGVRFHTSARVHIFSGVPADVAEAMRTAKHPGRFFLDRISRRYVES